MSGGNDIALASSVSLCWVCVGAAVLIVFLFLRYHLYDVMIGSVCGMDACFLIIAWHCMAWQCIALHCIFGREVEKKRQMTHARCNVEFASWERGKGVLQNRQRMNERFVHVTLLSLSLPRQNTGFVYQVER